VNWNGDFGNFFAPNTYAKTADPQCAAVAAELRPYCTLQAVTDARSGQILLQNPQPGKRGTLGRQTLYLPGQWSFDAALSKRMRIAESKSLQFRVDATNILNHPLPNLALSNVNNNPYTTPPGLNINSDVPFGFIQDKGTPSVTGSEKFREFKAQLRFDF